MRVSETAGPLRGPPTHGAVAGVVPVAESGALGGSRAEGAREDEHEEGETRRHSCASTESNRRSALPDVPRNFCVLKHCNAERALATRSEEEAAIYANTQKHRGPPSEALSPRVWGLAKTMRDCANGNLLPGKDRRV